MSELPDIWQLFPAGSGSATEKLDDETLLALYGSGQATGRSPWLSFNFVESVDGAATLAGLSGGLGNAADQHVFMLLRRIADVIMVGAGTIRAEGYGGELLSEDSRLWRSEHNLRPRPRLTIVSGRLDLEATSEVFTHAPERPLILTTDSAPTSRRAELESVADVVSVGTTDLDPHKLLAALAELGLTRIHSEGGPTLLGTFAKAGLVDELAVTISPLLVAGQSGRIAHSAEVTSASELDLAHVLRAESMLFLRYVRAATR